ncbi:MAG: FkbM family methyltransferase [Anaerolineae bacterium]|nr:FkbM family methyltransferase [Anaerolineae bacterium]
MAIEQPSHTSFSLLQMGLSIYRKTFKRLRPVHFALHWLLLHTWIPFLEQTQNFYTMPDDPFWFRVELLTQRHEPETAHHLQRLIQPKMTVLDVGAHVGYYSRMASNIVQDGRVIAFEPHPRNHEYLTRNVGKRSNVTILQVALAEKEGTAELYDYLMMSASGSLHYDERIRDVQMAQVSTLDVAPRIDKDFEPKIYTVRTALIDSLMDELGITSVDVVKMDIEGAELGALRGMARTIENSPNLALVMEYNPLGLEAFDCDPLAALQEVRDMGFTKMSVIETDASLTDYTSDTEGMADLTHRLMQNMGVVNMLFTR